MSDSAPSLAKQSFSDKNKAAQAPAFVLDEQWLAQLDKQAYQAWINLKSQCPQPGPQTLERAELISQRLARSRHVWINASLGYGKTTLLAQFAQQVKNQTSAKPAQRAALVWFQCEAQADASAHAELPNQTIASAFLRHLLFVAEHQLPGVATDALALLTRFAQQHPQALLKTAQAEQVLLLWLTQLSDFDGRVYLCLDDLHLLTSPSSLKLLQLIFAQCPNNVHLLLSSRFIPRELAALRLRDDIDWLSNKELALNDDQLQQYLQQQQVANSGRLVAALNRRLQGWPAALRLWLNCYRAMGKPIHPAPDLALAEISDYLEGEALHRLAPGQRLLLAKLAVFGRFNQAMLAECLFCDHSSDIRGSDNHTSDIQGSDTLSANTHGSDTSDADLAQTLALLIRDNLLIEAIAEQPGWYQLHPLMAQLLARQLSPALVTQLYTRAFHWHCAQQQPLAALTHAGKAGLQEEIIPWVEAQSEHILATLDIATLLQWFDILPEALLRSSSRLMQMAAWCWIFTQQRDKAEPLVLQLLAQQSLLDYERDALEGYLARLNGQLSKAEQLCKSALEHLPDERFMLRMLMAASLSHLRLAVMDADGARIWNRLAQDIARQRQAPAMEAQILFDYARIELNRGHISRSLAVTEQGLALLQRGAGRGGDISFPHYPGGQRLSRGRLLSYKAFLLWLGGAGFTELSEILQAGINASRDSHDIAVCYGYALQALTLTQEKRFDTALDLIDQAERLMQRWQVDLDSYQWLALIKANIWLSQKKFRRARSYIDDFVQQQHNGQLPRSESFPMLPGFVAVTSCRAHLLCGDYQQCLTEAEHWGRNLSQASGAATGNGQSLMGQVLNLLRLAALTRLRASNAAISTSSKASNSVSTSATDNACQAIQQQLQHEGVGLNLSAWFGDFAGPSAVTHADASALAPEAQLSERELEVLAHIDQGLSNQAIADQLFISLHTVKTHARKINVKLGVKSRTQALRRAKELGLI